MTDSPAQVDVDVVNVFADVRGRFGNPLGIVRASDASAGREQAIATALGFSETVFLDAASAAAARIRIFTPAVELPFAGHPTVGTAWWLREQGVEVRSLDVPAGRVDVTYDDDMAWIACDPRWSPEFAWLPLASPAAVDALDPAAYTTGMHYAWAWLDERAGRIRSRMFGPAVGVVEDEATGSAAARITALLERDLEIRQGQGSALRTRYLGADRVVLGGRTIDAGSRTV